MQYIPEDPGFIYAGSHQTVKHSNNKFLFVFSVKFYALCNRSLQLHVLRVQPLVQQLAKQISRSLHIL